MQITRTAVKTFQRIASTNDLMRAGMTARRIQDEVQAGQLVRLRAGWYVRREYWDAEYPETQHLFALSAAQRAVSSSRIFSHRSAAVLHNLPTWTTWLSSTPVPDPLVVTVTGSQNERASANPRLVRHRGALEACDVVTTSLGFTLTNEERTVFDLARTEPFEVALACADTLLRRQTRSGHRIDFGKWKVWQQRLLDRTALTPRGPGSRAVRALALLADPRSDSVLESVSRLRFLQVGIDVEQQVRVPAEHGGSYYLDFLLPRHGVFGECDGMAKYTSAEIRGEFTAEELVLLEKQRHDWVMGATGMRGIRWTARHTSTVTSFERMLTSFGIPVRRKATQSFGPHVAAFLDRLP